MGKRFTLAEVLATRGSGLRARPKPKTRQERLALAPKPPVSIQLTYTRGLFAILDGLRKISLDILAPLFVAQNTGLEAKAGRGVVLLSSKLDVADSAGLFALLRLKVGELGDSEDLAALVASIARSIDAKSAADLSRILGIDLTSDSALQAYLARFVRDNVNLITSVGFEQLDRMEGLVAGSVSGGIRVEALRDSILGSFDVAKSRAALIARDQTLKASADLTQVRQQRVGITEYIWSTSADERVRGKPGGTYENSQSNHWALDGKRFSWLAAPVTNPVTGARNHPGRDFQCRCVALPVVDSLLSDL